MNLTVAEVVEAISGRLLSGPADATFDAFHTDSRQATSGLFFALKGAETDGHLYVGDAIKRGARGVVVQSDRPPPRASPRTPPTNGGEIGASVVAVDDSWQALYDLAAYVLARVEPLVVAVTGSNGKTSTKELLAAALGTTYRVRSTEGNLNTETGVPLTLLGLEPGDQALVVEMGMSGPGEIARLAELARPRIGVITTVGTVHMEFFESREDLARAKGELVQALPAEGRAVLPAEDRFCRLLQDLSGAPATTFGLGAGDLSGESYQTLPDGCAFVARGTEVRLGMAGRHQARNALAALAAAEAAGVPVARAAPALADVRVGRRLQEVAAPGGFLIVDDSYNASPESMSAAFETVAERPRAGRLLAVLGEMRELGALAAEEHRRIGGEAALTFDAVAVMDEGQGRVLAESARGAELVPDVAAAAAWVRRRARAGDVVLVKASRGVRLERLVEDLLGERPSC
jgi:UDP-N-acetylmuramoyl-tripeptide--D-alanyl-D-alanine ligase